MVFDYGTSYEFSGYYFGIFDYSGNMMSRFLPENNNNQGKRTSDRIGNIYSLNDTISFSFKHIDTVFRITDSFEILPKYVFSSDASISPSQFQSRDNRVLFSYRESERFFFIVGFENNLVCNIIYDKFNSSLTELKPHGFKNDIDFGPKIWPREIVDESLIDIISPGDLIENERTNKSEVNIDPEKSNYIGIIGKISIDDNPIIRVVHLK